MTLIAVIIISLFVLVFFISKNSISQLVKEHEIEVRTIQSSQSDAQDRNEYLKQKVIKTTQGLQSQIEILGKQVSWLSQLDNIKGGN